MLYWTKMLLMALAVTALAWTGYVPSLEAKVTRSDNQGFVTRHEAQLEASPKQVWLALISPAKWWSPTHTWSSDPANMTLTPQAGGCFCERIPENPDPETFSLEGSVEHMRVIHAFPERALRMRGGLGPLQSEPATGVLTITIGKSDAGSRIVWEYVVGGSMRYEVAEIAQAVDEVMGQQLGRLARFLGGADLAEGDAGKADEGAEVEGPEDEGAEAAQPKAEAEAPEEAQAPQPNAEPDAKPNAPGSGADNQDEAARTSDARLLKLEEAVAKLEEDN